MFKQTSIIILIAIGVVLSRSVQNDVNNDNAVLLTNQVPSQTVNVTLKASENITNVQNGVDNVGSLGVSTESENSTVIGIPENAVQYLQIMSIFYVYGLPVTVSNSTTVKIENGLNIDGSNNTLKHTSNSLNTIEEKIQLRTLGTSFETLFKRHEQGIVADNFGGCKYCIESK
ncbi:uncharacterized protein LOC123307916 isoform X1 [Coccinella septempunctata]|uniref:uncharacterized protein LOC123307916 isoform X1 n=1 Tax=Coccinella septempunctata TaxID=41139 RepID=UPI001D0627B8|nr:uncharacterized protein LOC123307916 isoform X1 [Coccinella septempunctata]